MNFIQKTILRHKNYYKENNKTLTFKSFFIVFFIGFIYLLFYFVGAELYIHTIIEKKEILIPSFTLSTIIFVITISYSKKAKQELSIIPNFIIFYVHSILFLAIIILGVNFLTLNESYKKIKLPVLEWSLSRGKTTNTFAKVIYNNNVSELHFQGNILNSSTDSLIVEIKNGNLGYGFVRSFSIDNNLER